MFGHFNVVDAFFQIVVLLFAISVHESAHAWMANRLGDPTAKMLGRVSLNPIVHIDPFGTILMPAMLILLGFPPFGWAKPTPVDNRNFRNPVRDDILTAVAGPVSNFLTALVSVIVLAVIVHGSAGGVDRLFRGADVTSPLAQLFYEAMRINVILAVFNLIPLPPLDGSHVIRHFLSYNALQTYDRIGYFGLVIVMFVLPLIGFPIISMLISPFLQFFDSLLNALLRI
jgi:Zn-dependent protease